LAKKKGLSIADIYDAESSESTEFRRILHNLGKSTRGGQKQAVLITSATLSEGKSLIASFLAMTSAMHRYNKTLLIDFDLRRPTLHKLFDVKRQQGLAEIILDGLAPRNAVKATSVDKLDILTAGKFVVNPSDLLKSAEVHRITEEMKFYYDLILIDSAPLIPVMDSLILAEEFDAVLLVVKAGVTQRSVVARARELLNPQNGKIVGVVMNNMKKTLPYYYNYSYYGYHYKPNDK